MENEKYSAHKKQIADYKNDPNNLRLILAKIDSATNSNDSKKNGRESPIFETIPDKISKMAKNLQNELSF